MDSKQVFFLFWIVLFFRAYQSVLYNFLNIPLSFYETENFFKLYILEICIILAAASSLLLTGDVFH